jgi:thiol-disulfide isomerase/thioredoxin
MTRTLSILLGSLVLLGFIAVRPPSQAQQTVPDLYQNTSLCDSVLLEFYWEKCSACRNIAPFVDQTESHLKSKGLKVKRLNIYEGNNMALANAFQVNAVPAFFLFGGNKKTIETFPIGSVSGAQLEAKVQAAISKYRTRQKCD